MWPERARPGLVTVDGIAHAATVPTAAGAVTGASLRWAAPGFTTTTGTEQRRRTARLVEPKSARADLVLRGARIIDGSGNASFTGDVAVTGEVGIGKIPTGFGIEVDLSFLDEPQHGHRGEGLGDGAHAIRRLRARRHLVLEVGEAEPALETIACGATAMTAYQPDWVVGLGGGSPMDVAKLAAYLLGSGDELDAIFTAVDPDARQTIIGIRPGEKIHEVMVSEDDARHTVEHDDYYVILPEFTWWSRGHNGGEPCPEGFRYSSEINDDWLSVEQLRDIVRPIEESLGV